MKNFSPKFLFLIILFLVFPAVSFAQVVINEVQISPTGERFLELYNIGDVAINLTGWYMQRKTATGSSFGSLVSNPNFESKIINAHGYFVVSRNSLSSSNVVLNNLTLTESNTIQVKNSGGDIIDKVGWGDISDCDSLCPPNPSDGQSIQRVASEWVIASPTPGVANNTTNDVSRDDSYSGEVLGDSTSPSSSGGGSTTSNISSPSAKLEVSAGENRTTSPGSPIWFQATIKKNTTKNNIDLNWSFGDGHIGKGTLVSHTYKYPGDYVVVLNAKAGDIFSVDRLKVRVIDSDVTVSEEEEYLEIFNNSNAEINLFNWKIECKGKGFIFQPDTIILPKSSIKLDKDILKMKGYDNSMGISLKNFLGEEVFSAPYVEEIDMEKISLEVDEIQKRAYSLVNKAIDAKLVVESSPTPKNISLASQGEVKSESIKAEEKAEEVSSSTDNIIYEVPKKEGLFMRLTNFIKRVFSN